MLSPDKFKEENNKVSVNEKKVTELLDTLNNSLTSTSDKFRLMDSLIDLLIDLYKFAKNQLQILFDNYKIAYESHMSFLKLKNEILEELKASDLSIITYTEVEKAKNLQEFLKACEPCSTVFLKTMDNFIKTNKL